MSISRFSPVFLALIWVLSFGSGSALAQSPLEQVRSVLPAASGSPQPDGSPSPASPNTTTMVVPETDSPTPVSKASAAPADMRAPTPIVTPDPQKIGAEVTLNQRALFKIYTSSAVYSARERADIISQRLQPLLKSIDDRPIEIVYQDRIAVLKRQEQVLMTVTDNDAQWAQLSLPQLAEFYADTLRLGLRQEQVRYNMASLIFDVILALILTLILIGLLILLWRLFPWFFKRADTLRQKFLPEIRLKQAVLVSSEQLSHGVHFVLNLLRNIAVLVLLYIYLPLLLSLFPWTRGYSHTLLTYITVPLGKAIKALVNYIPSLFIVALITVGTYYFLKLIKLVFTAFDQGLITYRGFEREWAKPTYSIVRFLVLAFAAVVIFPYLPGSGSPAFQSISLFLGVLFSLGSSSAIANMVSGVVLTYMSPFQIGDRVKISDTMGDVIEKGLLVTRIRTTKNVGITIPNSMVLNSHIINYSSSAKREGLILHTTITLGYEIPWPQVHKALLEAADRTSGALKDPKPFILQTSLDDFYVSYELNIYTQEPNRMAGTYSELHQHIQDSCNEAGIEIMSCHYSAVRDGNLSTQPPQYLPQDYQAPRFRMNYQTESVQASGLKRPQDQDAVS